MGVSQGWDVFRNDISWGQSFCLPGFKGFVVSTVTLCCFSQLNFPPHESWCLLSISFRFSNGKIGRKTGFFRVQVGKYDGFGKHDYSSSHTYGCETMGSPSRLVSCYNWIVLMLCFISIHKALGNDDG